MHLVHKKLEKHSKQTKIQHKTSYYNILIQMSVCPKIKSTIKLILFKKTCKNPVQKDLNQQIMVNIHSSLKTPAARLPKTPISI